MSAGPRIDTYRWAGGTEAVLRYGPDRGALVIAALPLFEEANRTRALAGAILRALADRGIAGLLPDLPGQGESLIETQDARLPAMRSAHAALVAACLPRPVHALGIRSGALLDRDAPVISRWHLSPMTGGAVLSDLTRAAGGLPDTDPVELAGNRIAQTMIADLRDAIPADAAPRRVVRLDTDPRSADLHVAGPPLWRRSEPANDPALAVRLADDIAQWIATCAG